MHSTMIFGCGNLIMGDDGFGPSVVAMLGEAYQLPESAAAIDAMTGIREYLFDYLLTEVGRPEHIIILDAVDFPDRTAGDVFLIDSRSIPAKKIHDFSLHQFPTVNLLHELEEHTGITDTDVRAKVEPKAGRGVGIVEAPRGTLIHDYVTDENGCIEDANLIVGTTHNIGPMNMSVKQAATSLIKDGKYDQGILNKVEMAVRAYDP